LKVLFCGYRDWAIDIYNQLEDVEIATNQEEFQDKLSSNPDMIFFIGWSWIIQKEIVDKYFCICLHPSALPKYRGGSPIQHQIINGETESSVTLFKMNEKIDQGDIIFQQSFSLDGDLKDIFKRISKVGYIGIKKIIDQYPDLKLTRQKKEDATYYKRRTPSMSQIHIDDFKNYTSKEIYNKIRSLQDPYPNAFVECANGTKLYFQKVSYEE
jgi:methionyl-tRNA formyltransferase